MPEYNLIGLDGLVHIYPEWFYCLLYGTHRRAKRRFNVAQRQGYTGPFLPLLHRDKKTGYWRITPEAAAQLTPLLSTPHFNPRRQLHACGLASGGGRTVGKGLGDLLECGIDASVVRRELDLLARDLDATPLPGRTKQLEDDEVNKMIRELKAKRRCA